MYTRDDLIADVTKEANNIKQYATTEEINKLDFSRLVPTHRERCIYGQMTGNCFSDRASNLILACTPRYFKNDTMPGRSAETVNILHVLSHVNGAKVENFAIKRKEEYDFHFSAIEAYVVLEDAKNENLINYIKGNAQTLEL